MVLCCECKSELHSNHNKTIDFFSAEIFASSTRFTCGNNYCSYLPANLLIYWCVDVPSVPVQIRNWFLFSIYIKKNFFATTGRIIGSTIWRKEFSLSLNCRENVSLRKKTFLMTRSLFLLSKLTHTPVLLSKIICWFSSKFLNDHKTIEFSLAIALNAISLLFSLNVTWFWKINFLFI